jgi:flavin reductase (DIM6/NTAB) family NADH-FMN oxidoreductase RutF
MITKDEYRQVMSNWGTGVTVVTTAGKDGAPYGLTVSSFTSVSLDPVLVLVCLDNRLSGLQAFKDSMKFAVNILSEAQEEVSRLFAKKDTQRPAELYTTGRFGLPLIRHSLAALECETVAIHPGGDHLICVGEVKSLELMEGKNNKNPLLYFRGKYQRLI